MSGQKPVRWFLEPLKKYADFSGRARRSEYWWFSMFTTTISLFLGFVEGMMGVAPDSKYSLFAGVWCLAIMVPSIAVTVRRLHDTNRSGWWFLISLIPIVGAIVLLVFLAKDSAPGRNRFGPSPKVVSTGFTAAPAKAA